MCRTIVAKLKYTKSATASTIVVIKGDAMTAGSSPILLDTIGSVEPIIFAKSTVTTSVPHTTNATDADTLSTTWSFTKFAAAKVMPVRKATLISFHSTLKKSLNSISSSDSARIIVTEA